MKDRSIAVSYQFLRAASACQERMQHLVWECFGTHRHSLNYLNHEEETNFLRMSAVQNERARPRHHLQLQYLKTSIASKDQMKCKQRKQT